MSIHTNLKGRLRNTTLPKSQGLLPVFETVVNSIHSIEERGNLGVGSKIILIVKRESTLGLDAGGESNVPDIEGFEVIDNGVGFNDVNINSFETLDSDHKIDKGCRGVGRLLWLKAFTSVSIRSTFKSTANEVITRELTFDAATGVNLKKEYVTNDEVLTVVSLNGYDKKFRESSPKTVKAIANSLLEHCLWYFVRADGVPAITVKDDVDVIDLNSLYDSYMYESAYAQKIKIKDNDFELTHIKFRALSSKKHNLSLCAAGRLVREEAIGGKLPGLYGRLSDSKGEFIYSCYIASKYLDDRVRAERTSFDIAEDVVDIFSDTEITLKEIREEVLLCAREYLGKYLKENIQEGRNRVDTFVSNKAPRYRPILSRISEDNLIVDPAISDKDLELHLHKHLAEIEQEMLEKGHDIIKSFDGDVDDYQKRLNEYLQTAEEIKKSDLANYISHRRVIIDLLEKSIRRSSDGKYVKEDVIHKLIMPMGKDTTDLLSDGHNLWLVDERLAFHNYMASDKSLTSMPITGSSSAKEPDLCSLSVYDNPMLFSEQRALPLGSITVIEIKRPMRNDAAPGEEKDPIEQALGYLNRIRDGGVTTTDGRPIPNSGDIPGYCYVICDLTDSVIQRCQFLDLVVTSDHMGYFGYHKQYKAYIEVMSFDKLVHVAKERNRAFFDKLGLPSN